MSNPSATMKVKVFRIGRYAGPSVNDPQFETKSSNEIVEVNPATAAFLVDHGNGEIQAKEAPKEAPKSKSKGKGSKPSTVDKDNAEKE